MGADSTGDRQPRTQRAIVFTWHVTKKTGIQAEKGADNTYKVTTRRQFECPL